MIIIIVDVDFMTRNWSRSMLIGGLEDVVFNLCSSPGVQVDPRKTPLSLWKNIKSAQLAFMLRWSVQGVAKSHFATSNSPGLGYYWLSTLKIFCSMTRRGQWIRNDTMFPEHPVLISIPKWIVNIRTNIKLFPLYFH